MHSILSLNQPTLIILLFDFFVKILFLHVDSSKVGPLEPSCSFKDQLCFTLLVKGSNFRAHREYWSKVGPLKINLAPKDQLYLNTHIHSLLSNLAFTSSQIYSIKVLIKNWNLWYSITIAQQCLTFCLFHLAYNYVPY